jgi:hypothetical protein
MASTRSFDRRWFYLATAQPALMVGVLLMHRHMVSPTIWGLNLIAGLLLTVFCAGLSVGLPLPLNRFWRTTVIASAFVLLLATFADAGLDGVHRWVHLGPFRLHAAAICLPLLILALGENRSFAEGKPVGWLSPILGVGATALLVFQPDAAQATSFAGALLILLFWRPRPRWAVWLAALSSLVCAAWAWTRPDPLPSVRHVEGIVGLAAQSGVFWLVVSLVSLALLPLPFLFARRRDGSSSFTALALGVYFCLQAVMPWFGSFPVPLLGFGVSPIIGYFGALGWLVMASRPRSDTANHAVQQIPTGRDR